MNSLKGLFVFASLAFSIPLSAWASPPTCDLTATETGIAWRTDGAAASALTAWSGDGSLSKALSSALAGFLSYEDLRETFPFKTECTGPIPWLVGDNCTLILTAGALNEETCSASLDFYRKAKIPTEPTELDEHPSYRLVPNRPALPELDQITDLVKKVPSGVLGDKSITTLACRLSVTLSGGFFEMGYYDIAWSSGVNVKEATVTAPSDGAVLMPDGTSITTSSESPISKELGGKMKFLYESGRTANVVLAVTGLDGAVRQATCDLGAMTFGDRCVASCKALIAPAPPAEIGTGGSDTEAVPLEGAGFLDRLRRVFR